MNEMNKRQATSDGIPPPDCELFERVTQPEVDAGVKCLECLEPLELDQPYTTAVLFYSPNDTEGHKAYFHVEGKEHGKRCYDRLTDTSGVASIYFECCECGRFVCRQNPRNGWLVQHRELLDSNGHRTGNELCLQCYERDILGNRLPKLSFEDNVIPGMFLSNSDLRDAGFNPIEGFGNLYIRDWTDTVRYCKKVLELIRQGFKVVSNYERTGIEVSEGYVSLWAREENKDPDSLCEILFGHHDTPANNLNCLQAVVPALSSERETKVIGPNR